LNTSRRKKGSVNFDEKQMKLLKVAKSQGRQIGLSAVENQPKIIRKIFKELPFGSTCFAFT
jgi:hypothetical protein